MNLVEQHIINNNKKNKVMFSEIDSLSFNSKNLYNIANYIVRQEFITNKKYLNYYDVYALLKDGVDYKSLPTKISQEVLRQVDTVWKSFFKSIKSWKINKSKYNGMPLLPKYKHKKTGRNILVYNKQAIGVGYYKKYGVLKLSKSDILVKTKINIDDIIQVRLIPRLGNYVIEVVYNKEVNNVKLNQDNIMGIDLGVNNLCAITTTNNNNCLINGRPLKSINQYYNKKISKMKSILDKVNNKKTSKQIQKVTNKRNNKIKNYLHKTSKYIIDYCLTNDIGKVVIGKNIDWKQNINIGKKNNQSFVNIPFDKLIKQITYKGELNNIEVLLTEESYTSKCSFIDNEDIKKSNNYLGKRVKRGLFKSSDNYTINADINGSYNIIRKVFSNFTVSKNEIEGIVVSPKLISL